jgi:hypothetical protein
MTLKELPVYRIERRQYGWAVFGSIPCDELGAINRLAGKGAVVAFGVAAALGATLAICSKEKDVRAWQKIIDADIAARYGTDSPQAWLLGTDTGESSKTIYAVMTLEPSGSLKGCRGAYPLDADDFGRCFRLLERFPAWRPRLPEVAKAFPKWKKIVEAWSEMEELFAPVNDIFIRRREGERVTNAEQVKLNIGYAKVTTILYRIADDIHERAKH